MNLIFHHLRKDIRAQRWLLLIWAALLLLEIAVNTLTFQSDYERARQMQDFRITVLLTLAHGILWTALLVRLVQSEPAIGSTSFWLTRPIPPSIRLFSKLIFIFLLVIGAGFLPNLLFGMQLHADASELWNTLAGALLSQVACLIVVVWMATFTKSEAQFAGLVMVVLIGFYLVVVSRQIFLTPEQGIFGNAELSSTRTGLCILLFFPGLALSTLVQHVCYRRRWGLGIGLFSIVLGIGIARFFPVVLPWLSERAVSSSPSHIDFILEEGKHVFWSYPNNPDKVEAAALLFPAKNPPGTLAIPSWIDADFQGADGTSTSLTDDGGKWLNPSYGLLATDLIQSQLPGINLVHEPGDNWNAMPTSLFSIRSPDREKLRGQTGLLTLKIRGQIVKLDSLGAIRLDQPEAMVSFPGGFMRAHQGAHEFTLWSIRQGYQHAVYNQQPLYVLVDTVEHRGKIVRPYGSTSSRKDFSAFHVESSEATFSADSPDALAGKILYVFIPKEGDAFQSVLKVDNFLMYYK